MHLDVLKYPHHGAADNWTSEFFKAAVRRPLHLLRRRKTTIRVEVEPWAKKTEGKYPGVFNAHFNRKVAQVLAL